MYEIGHIIRDYRKALGWSQKHLAGKVNCSHSQISKVEAGKHTPTQELLDQLAEALHVKELSTIYQTDEQLKQELSTWKDALDKMYLDQAESIAKRLEKMFPTSHSHYVNHLYSLYRFRHVLLMNDMEEANLKLVSMESLATLLVKEDSFQCLKWIGLYYLKTHEYLKAFHYLKRAIDLDNHFYENDPEINLLLAFLQYHMEMTHNSTDHARYAMRLYREDYNFIPTYFCFLVLSANDILRKNHENAEKALASLIYQFPNDPRLSMYKILFLRRLAIAQFQQNKVQPALQHLRDAIQLERRQEKRIISVYHVATIYFEMGKYEHALDYVESGLTIQKNQTYRYHLEMLKYNINGRASIDHIEKEIIPFYEKTGNYPARFDCYKFIGQSYHNKRNYKGAAVYFLKGIELVAEARERYRTKITTKHQT
ncbi:transcriptional activator [Gracilibacillus halophilus YIM-C55.5]|uniref:Transcriptional activator n=1 Tax=Gracilibacillus halophilus YIM-C55.5 TaxID=1308866 RepID=N4WPR9_9BACI|nr:helix-turn-helix transcriptional regulator [Gracilibacillus halophilus]ENH98092.1 transcriptional activator [Gracilibacillus halophilus YIM-C55.5]